MRLLLLAMALVLRASEIDTEVSKGRRSRGYNPPALEGINWELDHSAVTIQASNTKRSGGRRNQAEIDESTDMT